MSSRDMMSRVIPSSLNAAPVAVSIDTEKHLFQLVVSPTGTGKPRRLGVEDQQSSLSARVFPPGGKTRSQAMGLRRMAPT